MYYRYMRLEIPLYIRRKSSISPACLKTLVELPQILSLEEEEAYKRTEAVNQQDLITSIHNVAGNKQAHRIKHVIRLKKVQNVNM